MNGKVSPSSYIYVPREKWTRKKRAGKRVNAEEQSNAASSVHTLSITSPLDDKEQRFDRGAGLLGRKSAIEGDDPNEALQLKPGGQKKRTLNAGEGAQGDNHNQLRKESKTITCWGRHPSGEAVSEGKS